MSTTDLTARYAILNSLANHSRGVDRADATLLGSAYHADATVDYGFYAGPAESLVAMLATAQKTSLPTLHRTSNCEIRVAGDRAVSESYVIAYVEEPEVQRMVFGRYLDRHERRDGAWRLSHRTYVLDGNTNRPGGAKRSDPPLSNDHFVPEGAKGASDPARTLIAHHQSAMRRLQKASPMNPDAAALDAALSRDAIRQLITTYCRAADRADTPLMRSIFWDDATIVSGVVNGGPDDFAREVTDFVLNSFASTFHSIANEWIEVAGDHGVGEHYVIAHNRNDTTETLTGGRYLDSYVRRDGVWKIHARTFICDWVSSQASTFEPGGFYEGLTTRGRFGQDDPVYAHWRSL